jgi:hypothetical protein
MYIFIFILIIILLVVFLFIRTKKYNNFLKDITRENFQTKIENKVDIKKELPANPNIVYCDFSGNTFFIKENKVWKIDHKNNIIINSESLNNVYNLPNSLNIKTGTLNNKNLIILTHENIVIEYDLLEKEVLSHTKLDEYFYELNENINCLLYYKNKYYIFNDNNIIIYNKNLEKIEGTQNAGNLFKNIPNNITCGFLNNNIVLENVSHGVPCFIRNKDMYFYDEKKNMTNNIDTNYGFMNNTKFYVIDFNNQKITFTPPKKSLYRIITIGAGNENGGYGGLVYNDYNLTKKDVLEIIVGSLGERLPLKDKVINHDKLPFSSSSAGSGGSFIYKKDKLLQCSGGGGGWSSEIIKAPSVASSFYKKQIKNNKVVIPIKKIVLTTKNTNYHNNSNIRQKIVVKKFSLDVYNYTQVDYSVVTQPKLNSTKFLYETDYNVYGNKSTITITFSKVLSDYTFNIDAHVLSTENDKNFFDLSIFDERDRVTTIKDFNKNYNNLDITSKTIISNFVKYPKTNCNNDKVKSGNKSSKKKEDLFDPSEDTKKPNENELHIVKLDGGVGGGGDSFFNRKIKNISCGGGGGYVGGTHVSLNDKFEKNTEQYLNLDYIAACGGQSYIENSKFEEDSFINSYNNENGKVVIIQVNPMQSFGNSKSNENNSTKYLKKTQELIKPVYKPIFEKRMNKVKFNKTKYEIKRPSINNDIRFDNLNYKIFTVNKDLRKGVNYFKYKVSPSSFDRNKIFIKSEKNIDVMILYFSVKTNNRVLVKDKKIKKDNIMKLNHGMIDPSSVNIFTFLERLIDNNIYKYVHSLNIEKITNTKNIVNTKNTSNTRNSENIEKLFDNKELLYEKTNFLHIENDIKKLSDVNYLYVLVKSNNVCKMKCNIVEYNSTSNNLTEKELKSQIVNI